MRSGVNINIPIDSTNPNIRLDLEPSVEDSKLVAIARDIYKASGKELSPDKASQIATKYEDDYERMLTDLYKASGKSITPEKIKQVEKHYQLVEPKRPVKKLSDDILSFNKRLDEVEQSLSSTQSWSGSVGADNPRMPPPMGFDDMKERETDRLTAEKSNLLNTFNYRPISYEEVVNSMGEGREDLDEVSQTSKIYLEKYTKRMQESLDRDEKNFSSPALKKAVEDRKNVSQDPAALDSSFGSLNESELDQYFKWESKYYVFEQQNELNKSTIYKKDDLRQGANRVARKAKDEDRSTKDALIKYFDEKGEYDLANRLRGLKADEYDGIASTSLYNTTDRVESFIKTAWRGVKEILNGVEKSTVYDKQYEEEFEKFLDKEVEEDVKKLLWGTRKTKYDGDIVEKQVKVNNVNLMLDDDGEVIGIRKKNGNKSYDYTEEELNAYRKYQNNKDEYKNKVSYDFRGGALLGKGTQVMTDMIPIVASTLVTRGAGGSHLGTYLGTFAVSYGDFYEQQFEKTGSVANASAFAAAASTMTAMLEGLGGVEGSIIRNASKKKLTQAIEDAASEVASKNVVNGETALKALSKHLIKNNLEETGIELLQSIGETGLDLMFNGESDLSWKELGEIAMITPFATGPISLGAVGIQGTFKNYEIEQLKIAARKKDIFNKTVDDWVNSSKTEEIRNKRQVEADYKKSLVEELSNSLLAADELDIIDPKLSKKIIEKSEDIVNKKKEIEKAKSDYTKNILQTELSEMQSDITALLEEGYKSKESLDKIIERAESEAADRLKRRKEKEFETITNDTELNRLNIVPDQKSDNVFEDRINTVEDYEAQYEDEYTEESVGEFNVKMSKLPEGSKETNLISEGIVESDGKVVGQFAVFGETAVEGSLEMAASLQETAQRKGVSSNTYKRVANQENKPILPASVNRDNGGSSSSFSVNASALWQSMADKGIAEEVEVTTKDGKVIRTLAVLPDGFTSTDTVKRIEDAAVEEFNIESEKFEQEESVETNMEEGTFVLNRKGTPVTYKIGKINTNKDGTVVSVTAIDQNGKTKTIRSKSVVAQLEADRLIHENKLIENEITEQELERAIADSGVSEDGRVQSDGSGQDTQSNSEEQTAQGNREDLLKQSVNYQGIQGTLVKNGDGSYSVITPDGDSILVEGGQSDATNGELGITRGKTNLELVEDEINEKKQERKRIRQELADAFVEVDSKIPPDATGEFVDAVNNMGGNNPVILASGMAKALSHKIGTTVQNSLGKKYIDNLRNLVKRLELLNKELSNKELSKKRKEARIKDAATEAKQIKAERKAKLKEFDKRLGIKPEPKKDRDSSKEQKTENKEKETTIKEEPSTTIETKEGKTNTDPISDNVWEEYVNTGKVPQQVLEKLADHFQNGTVNSMSQREFTIFSNMAPEIKRILLARNKNGEYTKKSAKEVVDNATEIMERRLKEISDVLTKVGFTQEQIIATATIFNKVAKRWARINNKSEAQFYSEVLAKVEVADLGSGRKAALKKVDGKYIIQLSESLEIDSPVHELAHIFENFLTQEEKNEVLKWAREDKWNRDASEKFAKGFIKFLEDGSTDGLSDNVFKKFKQWLADLYHGFIDYKGVEIPSLNTEMKEIYSKMMNSEVKVATKENYDQSAKTISDYYDRFLSIGVKFKKELFDDIARSLGIETDQSSPLWGISSNLRKFSYTPRKLQNILKRAVEHGYTNINNAMQYANDAIVDMANDPDYLPTANAEQLLGYGYALLTMEQGLSVLEDKIKKNPTDQRTKDMRQELIDDINDLSQVLSLARSEAGLRLRAGSFNLTKQMYSAYNVIKSTEAKYGRKLTQVEERRIKQLSAKQIELIDEMDQALKSKDGLTDKQRKEIANEIIVSGIFDNPFFKDSINEVKKSSPRQKSSRLKDKIDKINKIISDRPDILYDEESGVTTEEFFKEMRELISILVGSDSSINSFTKLHEVIESIIPAISQDALLNVLVWSDPTYQASQAGKVASSSAIIKRESQLLDKLREYLTKTFNEVEKTGNKTIYPTRLDTLDKFIEELKFLASSDKAISDESFMEASTHLEALSVFFNDLTLDKVDFNTINIDDLIDKVNKYEKARKLSSRINEIKKLDEIAKQLREGTYEGDLNDFSIGIDDELVRYRLEEYADKFGLSNEDGYRFADRSFKILREISNILKRSDGPKIIEDFKTLYKAVKESLPEDFDLTERDLYSALTHKTITPESLSQEYKNMKKDIDAELKALDRLERFLRKGDHKLKSSDDADSSKPFKQLELLLSDVEKLAKRRYQFYSNETLDELDRRFKDILDNYHSILTGQISSMSIDDLISEVSKIREEEDYQRLSDKSIVELSKLLGTERKTPLENNIFEILPEILPKLISERIENLKQEISQDVKQQRLIKVDRVLDIIRDKIKNNTKKEFRESLEYTAIEEFLNNEKRRTDTKSEVIKLNRQVNLKRAELKSYINSLGSNEHLLAKFINTPRLLVLAGDISFVTYQGGVMLAAHPIHAANAFKHMMWSAFSHRNWINQLSDLKMDDYYDAAVSSGLKMVDELSLELEEELRLSTIFDNFRIFREFRRFGERIYSSYMNHLRFSIFKEYVEAMGPSYYLSSNKQYGSLSESQRKVVGLLSEEINMHTGSASNFFGDNNYNENFNSLLTAGTAVFIAPRLYASVYRSTASMLGSVVGRDSLRIKKIKKQGVASDKNLITYYNKRRIRNLKKLGALAGFHISMLALFSPLLTAFNPFDWEDGEEDRDKIMQTTFNPYSGNFLKLQKGQRVFSLSPFVSYYRYAFRLLGESLENHGVIDPNYFSKSREMDKKNGFIPHTFDFFKYRFTPFFTSANALITNTDWDGKKITEYELFNRKEFLPAAGELSVAFLKMFLAPIWVSGVIDNYQRKTMDQAIPEAIIDFVGINSYTQEAYQDTEVKNKISKEGFRVTYGDVPKWLDHKKEEIKSETKRKFGEWLKNELNNKRNPSKIQMKKQNDLIFNQEKRKAIRNN